MSASDQQFLNIGGPAGTTSAQDLDFPPGSIPDRPASSRSRVGKSARCLSSTSSWSSRLTEPVRLGARGGSPALSAGARRKRSGGNPFRGVRAFAARGIMGLRAGGQSP